MLELDKSQQQIQKAVRDFAKGEFDKDGILDLEKAHEYPKDIWQKAADLGFIGIHFPEAFSGAGLGSFENAIIAEALCTRDSTLGITLTMAGEASECILHFGDNGLKEKYLPQVAEGKMLSGGAFTEPGNGYDLTRLTTTAKHDGSQWVINGSKTFVTNGGVAGFYIVLCQTDETIDPALKGQSMFLVEADTQGLSARDMGDKLGINMMPTSALDFKDVRVPEENLIGRQGQGADIVQKFYDENRLQIAAQAVGIAQGAFERALVYIKGREQFDRPIAAFQTVRHKISDMAAKIEYARQITYGAARQYDKGKREPGTSAMAKLVATRSAMEVTDEAVQLLGGYGYMTEYEVEHFYRDAKVLEIRGGNRHILKDIIADGLIGRLK